MNRISRRLVSCDEPEIVLAQSKRGQVQEPRNLSIYLARKHSSLKLSEIGFEFGLEEYSSVSSIVIRVKRAQVLASLLSLCVVFGKYGQTTTN